MNDISDLNKSIPAQLLNAGKRIAQLLDERLDSVDLSSAKLWALQSIATSHQLTSPVTVTCLAGVMNTTKSNVTAMVDRLIGEGLVTRRHSEEDRRTVIIALTEEGQRRYTAGVEVVRSFHIELSNLFSVEEQQLLNCLIEKLPE